MNFFLSFQVLFILVSSFSLFIFLFSKIFHSSFFFVFHQFSFHFSLSSAFFIVFLNKKNFFLKKIKKCFSFFSFLRIFILENCSSRSITLITPYYFRVLTIHFSMIMIQNDSFFPILLSSFFGKFDLHLPGYLHIFPLLISLIMMKKTKSEKMLIIFQKKLLILKNLLSFFLDFINS